MALAVGTSPAPVTGTGTTATTASFTPAASSLLVAVAATGNSAGSGTITGAVTDSLSSTWTLLKRMNTAGDGSAEVWAMDAGASPAARTVTLTGTSSGVALSVAVFTGAVTTSQILTAGASTSRSATAWTIALTPNLSGSLIVASFVESVAAVALTANAATSVAAPFQAVNDATNGETYALCVGSATTTGGSAQTLGFTNTAAATEAVAVEIADAAVFGTGARGTAPRVFPSGAVVRAGSW